MTAEDQENIRTFVEGMAVSAIMRPSKRDKQEAPGPSDLADKCDFCVARKIAAFLGLGDRGERGFSLKAWIGTAIHEKLERDLKFVYPHAEQEIEVVIGNVPGIGLVKGHVDVFLPRKRSIIDWKSTDLKKLRDYRTHSGPSAYTQNLTIQERDELKELKEREGVGMLSEAEVGRMMMLMSLAEEHSGGVPSEYLGQTMLYLYGLRAMGREADHAVLAFIPRDSNDVADIWVASCNYRPDVAEGVLRRATQLAMVVRSGGLPGLKPHPQCFPCSIAPKLRRR